MLEVPMSQISARDVSTASVQEGKPSSVAGFNPPFINLPEKQYLS